MEAADWYLPVYAIWFWLIPSLFIFAMLVLSPIVFFTFKQYHTHSKSYKNFWNTMEFLWIIGGSASILGMISQSWDILNKPFVEWIFSDVKDQYGSIQKMAKATFAQYYQPATSNADSFCNIISKILAMLEPTVENLMSNNDNEVVTSKTYYEAFNKATEGFAHVDPVAVSLGLELKDYNVFAGALPYEMKGIFSFPNWAFWLRAFAPQLFSFVLGIKIMRAVAAFAM